MFELKKKVCKECHKEKALILFGKTRTWHDCVCLDCKNLRVKKSHDKLYGKRDPNYRPNFGYIGGL